MAGRVKILKKNRRYMVWDVSSFKLRRSILSIKNPLNTNVLKFYNKYIHASLLPILLISNCLSGRCAFPRHPLVTTFEQIEQEHDLAAIG